MSFHRLPSHRETTVIIKFCIYVQDFSKIYEINNFRMHDLLNVVFPNFNSRNLFEEILMFSNENVIMHIINKSQGLSTDYNIPTHRKAMHYICYHVPQLALKLLDKLPTSIFCDEDIKKLRPYQILILYGKRINISKLFTKNFDVNIMNYAHIICANCPQYFSLVKDKINYEIKDTVSESTPIHFLFKNATYNCIKLFLEMDIGFDLLCTNKKDKTPIDYLQENVFVDSSAKTELMALSIKKITKQKRKNENLQGSVTSTDNFSMPLKKRKIHN